MTVDIWNITRKQLGRDEDTNDGGRVVNAR